MFDKIFKSRYSIIAAFITFFLLASFLIRTWFLIKTFAQFHPTIANVVRIYGQGFIFDLGVAIFFSFAYSLYLLFLPQRWNTSKINKTFTYTGVTLVLFIVMFSFFAELSFWNEFGSRFNFIAVDYLVYTYEVINNIAESYPLPLLIGGMLAATLLIIWFFHKRNVFKNSFSIITPFKTRVLVTGSIVSLAIIYGFFIKNSWAEQSRNHYQNELAKAGIYSFFSAFKNNELNYEQFYQLVDNKKAFTTVRKELQQTGAVFLQDGPSIKRNIIQQGSQLRPNVIMITIESFSASFMKYFGDSNNITPTLDSLALNSILFTNMYSTGTRTVRGMEALSLSIPPTPGNSVVRRSDNSKLTTVGNIFNKAGYQSSFFYGGDGYFDNMNKYFGNNGYNITDRGRKLIGREGITSARNIIPDSMVDFENAWGICDENLYDAVIAGADQKYAAGQTFYDFVMTTSNHQPFTYPSGKIDIPSGTGREGAVKYTDYAIGQFLRKIKNKPWFKNTVLIFVADHCASSAGKNEIDISKYHIPCMIVNLPNTAPKTIDKMCSQIDLYPTLFSLMGWDYESNLYGENVLDNDYTPRLLLGTYQKLAYLKKDSLVILGPLRTAETYFYNKSTNEQVPHKLPRSLVDEAIAQYQTAYDLYKNGGLRQ